MSAELHRAEPSGRWQSLGAIVAVAAVLRLAWLVFVPVAPVSDGVLYEAFAQSIAAGRGYAFPAGNLTAYWPVGTSAVYAAVFAVVGPSRLAIGILQVLVGVGIVMLTWRLARATTSPRTAAIAGWAMTCWPLLVEFTSVMASELLFTFVLLLALNVRITLRLAALLKAALWGAVIAAATYIRPTAWPLLLLFPLGAAIVTRRWREHFLGALVALLAAMLVFAPWVMRNERVLGRFVLVAANGGANLWMGNNPVSDGGYMALPDDVPANEADRDRVLRARALRYIREHPAAYAALCVRRAVTTFGRETIGAAWNQASLVERYGPAALAPVKLVSTAYWWAMLLLGLGGLAAIVARKELATAWPLLVCAAFFVAVPVLTVSQDRYHFPVDPFLAVFAAHAMVLLRDRARAESSAAVAGVAAPQARRAVRTESGPPQRGMPRVQRHAAAARRGPKLCERVVMPFAAAGLR